MISTNLVYIFLIYQCFYFEEKKTFLQIAPSVFINHSVLKFVFKSHKPLCYGFCHDKFMLTALNTNNKVSNGSLCVLTFPVSVSAPGEGGPYVVQITRQTGPIKSSSKITVSVFIRDSHSYKFPSRVFQVLQQQDVMVPVHCLSVNHNSFCM